MSNSEFTPKKMPEIRVHFYYEEGQERSFSQPGINAEVHPEAIELWGKVLPEYIEKAMIEMYGNDWTNEILAMSREERRVP